MSALLLPPLTPEQLHVLQHSLGADEYGRWPTGHDDYYRNRYVGESVACNELVAIGLMVKRDGHPELTGGDPVYHVTPAEGNPVTPPIAKTPRDHAVALDPGHARPAWLRSKDPNRVAAAMVQCEHPGAFCFEDGFCHRNNWCFAWVRLRVGRLRRMRDEIDRRIQRIMQSVDGDDA